jgi:hypothetical protein
MNVPAAIAMTLLPHQAITLRLSRW